MAPTRALTPTARAILGFLSLQPRSGYEIRAAARRSTELMWGVNDGQLYPQLHDLHERGLIEPAAEPEGPKSRQHWRLTDAGRSINADYLVHDDRPGTSHDQRTRLVHASCSRMKTRSGSRRAPCCNSRKPETALVACLGRMRGNAPVRS